MTRTPVPPISYPRSHADQITNVRAGWTPEDVADYQRRGSMPWRGRAWAMSDHETDEERLARSIGVLLGMVMFLAGVVLFGFQGTPRTIDRASDRSGGEMVHTRPLVEDGYMLPSAFAPIGSISIPGTGMSYGGF